MRDQIARFQNGFALRRVSWQQMKIANRNTSLAFGAADVNRRFERRQGHVHVGRISRDAMFAGAQNGQTAIHSRDRRATRAGLAFIARHGGIAKIHAARALQ